MILGWEPQSKQTNPWIANCFGGSVWMNISAEMSSTAAPKEDCMNHQHIRKEPHSGHLSLIQAAWITHQAFPAIQQNKLNPALLCRMRWAAKILLPEARSIGCEVWCSPEYKPKGFPRLGCSLQSMAKATTACSQPAKGMPIAQLQQRLAWHMLTPCVTHWGKGFRYCKALSARPQTGMSKFQHARGNKPSLLLQHHPDTVFLPLATAWRVHAAWQEA